MPPDEQVEIVRRLRTAEGHLEAVIGMMESDESCEKVLHQLGAVQAALRAAGARLLTCQVKHSEDVIRNSHSPEDRAAELKRLCNLYQLLTQYSECDRKVTNE